MRRTQVQFTEEQMEALRREATRRSVSVSEAVRQAVDAWVTADRRPTDEEIRRRALSVIGRFASGKTDVATRHDDYLSEA
ncbi:MAG: ribbon-helix-helix protein, CopG family, partial [Gemmatimonadota bacterium]